MEASPLAPIAGRTLQALPLDLQGLFRLNVIKTWMDVIEHYTKRDLTKKRDKLPAIRLLPGKRTISEVPIPCWRMEG